MIIKRNLKLREDIKLRDEDLLFENMKNKVEKDDIMKLKDTFSLEGSIMKYMKEIGRW